MKKLSKPTTLIVIALTLGVLGSGLIAQVVTRAAAGRTTTSTRLDPLTITEVPAIATPAPATAPAAELSAAGSATIVSGRTPRPTIVETRSPGRPAPIVPIPR